MKINYALGEPPQSEQLTEEKYTVNEDEDSEGIYIEFDIPISEKYKYWTTRVYIEGLGPVAEEVQYTDSSKKRGCFYYPFVEAGKEYTIRFVFLRDEDRDENNKDISFGHRGNDGSIGWFETKVTAGSESKGEVRFTSKGKIDVKKNGEFKFIEKPTFQNEDLLDGKWEVDIGLVEGISWEHGPERWTKWHSMQIPNDELDDPIDLYEDQEKEKTEYSIDFICVRPILNYTHTDGKTYKYQWDSFVRDIYYPPIANSDLINGIYVEYPVLQKEEYSRCDVYIDGIGKVAEMKDDSINFLDSNKSQASFFYPFVEPGKKYTVRFSFKKQELEDSEGFTIPTPDDTIIEYSYPVTVGAKSKGEVRVKSKGKASVDGKGNLSFMEKPSFYNQDLLTGEGYDWAVEMGLMEGISWEHDTERRSIWHYTHQIERVDLDEPYNLYESQNSNPEEKYSVDCVCIRPILQGYKYKGKTYNYQWDGFVRDIYYPPRNTNSIYGIYLEFDLPQKPFSRCDVIIEGIGKVAERVCVLDESNTKGCFFYPFVEPDKEYTIDFSFKKLEPSDSEGFTIPTPGDDTLKSFTKKVTAGSESKGEVRLTNSGWIHTDDSYNIMYFEKPEFEHETRLTGKTYDWEIEIGLVEGISWEHGAERRTKWHCAVHIPQNTSYWYNINLRNLCEQQEYDPEENHISGHDIDFLCVRPIMSYEQNGKIYNYMWDGYTSDVCYPPNDPNRLYGIYVELDLPKQPSSRCDVTINGIGKVAEEVLKLDGNRGCFFYPFVEPSKEYTIHFSFKDIEIPDSEGFVCYTTKNDTLSEVKMNVTAGSRAKGEVRLPKKKHAILKADSKYKITYFQKPEFENELLLDDNWMIEIGLMEGVSWNHGEERRTKWHCAVAIPKRDFDKVENKNLRDLELSPRNDKPCNHDHEIDCICVRPIMSYEHNGKTYNYMWDGDAFDVHYPLDFQEIDISDPADIAKIQGTWTQIQEWDYETEHSLAKVHAVWNETLVIDDANVSNSYLCTYKKANGSAFTKQEIIDEFCYDNLSNELPDNYFGYEVGEFYYDYELEWNPNPTKYTYKIYLLHSDMTLSQDWRTITDKDERKDSLSEFFGNRNDYQYNDFKTVELKLSKDGSQLYIFWTYKNDKGYDEWTDIYKKQQ